MDLSSIVVFTHIKAHARFFTVYPFIYVATLLTLAEMISVLCLRHAPILSVNHTHFGSVKHIN